MSLYPWRSSAGAPSPQQQLDPSPTPRIKEDDAPAVEPVTAAELADVLKVSAQDEGAFLTALLTAARAWCEAWTGRFFITRSAALWLDFFPPSRVIEIQAVPVTEVASVTTYDTDDVPTVMDADDYQVDLVAEPARIMLKAGVVPPTGMRNLNAVKVAFTAGYADAASVPENIKTAVRLFAAEVYLARGEQVDARDFARNNVAPKDALMLLEPFKVIR